VSAAARFRARAREKIRIPGQLSSSSRAGLRADVEVTDISLGGACLHLSVALGIGDAVSIGLVFPARWDPLLLSGRVAWIAASEEGEVMHAGVAFDATDARTTLDLYRLVGDYGRDY
jgi:hypothetical protein